MLTISPFLPSFCLLLIYSHILVIYTKHIPSFPFQRVYPRSLQQRHRTDSPVQPLHSHAAVFLVPMAHGSCKPPHHCA
ncbi:hypothetical protein QBC44DRAFT_325800 [Cladorrhinum sp. PSN332]|nr:hypothetical protein QBC44DRAFT_325800 [Cladorrhinum sp. PSN332]